MPRRARQGGSKAQACAAWHDVEAQGQQALGFLDLPPGCLERIWQLALPSTKESLCGVSKELRGSLFSPKDQCIVRLDSGDKEGAKQAGRAAHLPDGLRLAKLTVLPSEFLTEGWQWSPYGLVKVFLSRLVKRRSALTSQCRELVIKGFTIRPELMQIINKAFPALHSLTLHTCELQRGSFTAIARSLPDLEHLACAHAELWPDPSDISHDLEHLASLRLQSLVLTQTPGRAPVAWVEGGSAHIDFSFLQQPLASTLTRLVTHTSHVRGWIYRPYQAQAALQRDLQHKAQLPDLHSLALAVHDNTIQPNSLAPLIVLTSLQELNLGEEGDLCGELLASLAPLTQVTKLTVGSLTEALDHELSALPGVDWGASWKELHLLGNDCLGGNACDVLQIQQGVAVFGQHLGLYDDAGPDADGSLDPYWPYVSGVAHIASSNPRFHLGADGMLRLHCTVPDAWERYLRFKASFRCWEFLQPFDALLQGLELSDFDLSEQDVQQLGGQLGKQLRTLRLVNCVATPAALLALLPEPAQPLRIPTHQRFAALQRLEVVWCQGPHDQWLPALSKICKAWPLGRELHLHLAAPTHMLQAAKQLATRVMRPRSVPPAAQPQQPQQPLTTQQVQPVGVQTRRQARQQAKQQSEPPPQCSTATQTATRTTVAAGTSLAACRQAAITTNTRHASTAKPQSARVPAPAVAATEPSPITVSVTTWGEEQDREESDEWQGAGHHSYVGFTGKRASWGDTEEEEEECHLSDEAYRYQFCECCGYFPCPRMWPSAPRYKRKGGHPWEYCRPSVIW